MRLLVAVDHQEIQEVKVYFHIKDPLHQQLPPQEMYSIYLELLVEVEEAEREDLRKLLVKVLTV